MEPTDPLRAIRNWLIQPVQQYTMLVMMRLCAPRSRQLLFTSCLLGHKAITSRLLLINPSWNRTFATAGTRTTGNEGPPKDPMKVRVKAEVERTEKVTGRVGKVKSSATQQTVGVWSDEQMSKLEELVAEHTIEPEYSESLQGMTKRATDWATIGRLLTANPEECKAKWKAKQASKMKTGRFTAEEDALIRQRVAEWGDKGRGLWASLGREMGRNRDVILARYKTVIIHDSSSARTLWTSAMDDRLTEGVALYKEKDGWVRVAEHVGGGVTAEQCMKRWSSYLGHIQQESIKQGDWSDEEKHQLEELVPQHVIKPYWSENTKAMTKERIDWSAIGQQLNRIPKDCRNKWNAIQASKMKQGPFTAEEDALIRQRVEEWEGLWVSLQKEMGRPASFIRMHWMNVLATRELDWVPKESYEEWTFTPLLNREKSKFEWNDDMDARLKEGVAEHKEKEGWAGVAKYVGDSVTAVQCKDRWQQHGSKVHKDGVRRAKWSDTEVAELQQLVLQHVIEPHWSEEMGVTTHERTDWIAVADKLNRMPKDCKGKWQGQNYSKMKRGPFTAEEDALIRQRVAEWGNKGNGLWVSLGKEMGRSPTYISSRWRHDLGGQRLPCDV